jgi:hypothetical protein
MLLYSQFPSIARFPLGSCELGLSTVDRELFELLYGLAMPLDIILNGPSVAFFRSGENCILHQGAFKLFPYGKVEQYLKSVLCGANPKNTSTFYL